MKKILAEEPFNVMAHSFSFYCADEVTLNYSCDGVHFTPYTDATPAGETCIVNGVAKGMVFKLMGNTGEAIINF